MSGSTISKRAANEGSAPVSREDLIARIDAWLADVLCGAETRWQAFPAYPDWDALVLERIVFHGISVILAEKRSSFDGWPDAVMHEVRDIAVERAMWEMVHKLTIGEAIEALAREGVEVIVLKGSALAYSLAERPVLRMRGDTDILIASADIEKASNVLAAKGYECVSGNDEMSEDLEALWVIEEPVGTVHKLDLHWHAMAVPALGGVLPYDACLRATEPLASFSPSALRLEYPMMLVHAAVHRAHHAVTPYMAGGKVYHDADRLIWIWDFDVLARALDEAGWRRFVTLACDYGVAPICREALEATQRLLATPVPAAVLDDLSEARARSAQTAFLEEGQFGRSWRNFLAIEGAGRKAAFLRGKLLPSRKFMRDKYAHMPRVPLPLLYVWRIAELFVKRPRERAS